MPISQKTISNLAFIFFSTAIFFLFGYFEYFSLGPYSIHAWRQSDSYSFALSYYYQGNNLLSPEVLFIGEAGHGKAVSEFPIIYFITAKIWQLTSPNPGTVRMIDFLILLTGLFHLKLLSSKILKSEFWSFFIVFFVFSSPLLGYYSFNFIPNIPALGLALTASYNYYLFFLKGRNYQLVLASFLFALAALIKVDSLFLLLAITFTALVVNIKSIQTYWPVFLKTAISFVFIIGTYAYWLHYAKQYNEQGIQGLFNQSSIPIWNIDASTISNILDDAYFKVLPQFFHVKTLILLLVLMFVSFFFIRKERNYLSVLTATLFAGIISFILLFFQGLNEHDYFLINSLVLIPTILITVLDLARQRMPYLYNARWLKTTAVILLIFLINNGMIITRSHYNPNSPLVKYNIQLPKGQKEYWEYIYSVIKETDLPYQGINKYLDKIGIDQNDKIITIPDETPNKTLSIMQKRGFSGYHYNNNYKDPDKIERMKYLGATYLIVQGEENLKREDVKSYTQTLVGTYNNVFIFKLNDVSKD